MVDQVIKLKRNTTNTNAPGTSDIAVGELAIGAVAGKLYIRKSDDSILEFTDASASSSAADDISTGDAAVTIATTSGNITIDAQSNDSDIIFKGTDGGSDTTFLTLDGSAAGAATFNDKIVATELDISGDVDIDGTLEADAVTVNGTALSSVIAGTTVTLASTATALANARTIGGVSFDGSANITPTTFAAATFSGDVNVDSGVLFADVSENRVGINQTSPDVSLDLGANTDSIHVPVGTTAQRPGSPAAGYFRYNSTTGKFEGYTDSWGSIGGGSGTNMDTNIFTGDGSDTTFTLSTAPDTENNLMVFVDGVFQAQNVYSVSGTTLTFATAPANGRVITVYHSTTTVGGSNNSIATMTGDGSDTTLTLSVAPVHENNVSVFFDGVYQSKANYSISGTTLTFSTAPANGVAVEAITATNTTSTTANQLIDADGDTLIQVEESSDEDIIRFDIAGTEQIVLADGVLRPTTNNDIDLGTSSLEFKDAFFDGTVTSDAFAGPLTGDVTGNVSGSAATVTGAAQTNITSVGTLSSLAVSGDATFDTSTLKVDSTNNRVGIGTASPVTKLHISQGSTGVSSLSRDASDYAIFLDAVQNTDYFQGALGFGESSSQVSSAIAGYDAGGSGAHGLIFATGTASALSERLRIDSSGNIQIVGGNQMTQGLFFYNGGDGHLLSGIRNKSHSSYNDSGGLEFLTSGTSNAAESVKMSIDTQGNVGIGTTSPNASLDVVSDSSANGIEIRGRSADNISQLTFESNDSGTTYSQLQSLSTELKVKAVANIPISFHTNNTERSRILANGRTAWSANGIGDVTTVPRDFAFYTEGSTNGVEVRSNDYRLCMIGAGGSSGSAVDSGYVAIASDGTTKIALNANGTSFIDSGVLAIGDDSPESGDAESTKTLFLESGECVMVIKNTDATSSSQRQSIAFLNSSGTRVGTITTTSSATGYATSSDYRLKENVADMTNATTRLKQLKPKRFNWIVDETNTLVDGFLAHEVQSVVPEAITGEKDGEEMQGIDQSKLIPLLVKTIQELEERIATLEG